MADNIKPEISLGVKGPQVMSLGDLLGTATKAMEYSRLSELYPELIKKTQAESAAAQYGVEEKRLNSITSSMTALINNPMVISAEQDPNSVDPKKLIGYVTEHGFNQARMLGIPEDKAQTLMAPYIKIATENPGALRGYAKERLLAGLDTASRVSVLGGAPAIGVSTVPPNQPAFRGVRPQDMTAPITPATQPEVKPVAPPEQQVSPIQPPAQPPAQGQTTGRAGFNLPYEPPRPGIPRATTPSEQADLSTGQKYRNDLISGQQTVPKAIRNVDAVLSGIKELEKDRRFTTGSPQQAERAIREFFGDERFKQLSKDIANVELAVLQASGANMSTDAGKSLVAKANGDETYPPSVLLSVANRLAGDLTRLDMEAQGVQKFAQQFGDSNIPAFRQAWAANADQKIFEAMFINKNERDPKRKQAALDKILPTSREELADFLTKYENIQKLTKTGRL